MPAYTQDPLHRRLTVISVPTPPTALRHVLPVCLQAVRAAADAGWEVWTCAAPGLDEFVAAELVEHGNAVTVVLPDTPPDSHWVRALRAVYGRAVRLVLCAKEMRLAWGGMARVHYPDALPAPLPVLSVSHALVDGAAITVLLPPPSGPDPAIEHAAWLCRLLGVQMFDVATISGLISLDRALPRDRRA